jgi:hypothetical protein
MTFFLIDRLGSVENSKAHVATAMVNALGIDITQFASLIVARLRKQHSEYTLIEFLYHFGVSLTVQKGKTHPFILACLDNGVIEVITGNLSRLTTSKLEPFVPYSAQHKFIGWSFAFLARFVESDDPVKWLSQSLYAGLVPAFVYLQRTQDVLFQWSRGVEIGNSAHLLIGIIPKYLFHRTVVDPARASVLAVRSDLQYGPMLKVLDTKSSLSGRIWADFEDLVVERFTQMQMGVFVEPAVCGNSKVSFLLVTLSQY